MLALPLLISCASEPTRLYVLSADTTRAAVGSEQGIPIGIGPVSLPRYLDRPEVVTRTASNSLVEANLDQWGGDFTDNITHVLATNLANLLNTDRVSFYPWKNAAPVDFQVTLDVAKFEQGPDGSSVLDVFWSLVRPRDGTVLVMRRSTYRESGIAGPVSESAKAHTRFYDAVAAAMSRNLEALSRDIAAAIRKAPKA